MDLNQRNLQVLGIARKAGLLAVGGEAVCAAARAGKARLIISAADASESAVRRARHNSQMSGAVHVCVEHTGFELGNVTGRGSPVTVAVLDAGLAIGFMRGLTAAEPARYSETMGLMERMGEKSKSKRRADL